MFDDEAIEGYYKPPPADTFQLYTRTHLQREGEGVVVIGGEGKEDEEQGPPEIKIHMVGSHPLWGHLLWNAAIVIAEEIDARRIDVRGKRQSSPFSPLLLSPSPLFYLFLSLSSLSLSCSPPLLLILLLLLSSPQSSRTRSRFCTSLSSSALESMFLRFNYRLSRCTPS
jgi:hypothetical protein